MSRVRSLPTWMLRLAMRLPSMRGLWAEAYIELYRREVESELAVIANDESGPWLVAPPPGMH